MRIGTSYFESFAAARRYYAAYGYKAGDTKAKLDAGEIHIGRPPRQAGQSVGVIHGEGRYYLVEESSTIVPCGWNNAETSVEG